MGDSLWLGAPYLVPVLVTHEQEGEGLEAKADEDLSEYGEEQRAWDQTWGGTLRNQHVPRRIQTHWVWKKINKIKSLQINDIKHREHTYSVGRSIHTDPPFY